mmetsp:Transcript_25408/g.51688  ORF Transcript_25408/g.51688 Transcript_25408/m.51688 type:complete len:133 (+) Transcript_25408:147-545(+)
MHEKRYRRTIKHTERQRPRQRESFMPTARRQDKTRLIDRDEYFGKEKTVQLLRADPGRSEGNCHRKHWYTIVCQAAPNLLQPSVQAPKHAYRWMISLAGAMSICSVMYRGRGREEGKERMKGGGREDEQTEE